MAFWCKGKKDFCNEEECNSCKFENGSGGIEIDDANDDIIIRQWISVKDRLPPHQGKKVLVINGHGDVRIYALWKREYGNKWTWIDENGKFNHVNDITHWMPLPEPPKEE